MPAYWVWTSAVGQNQSGMRCAVKRLLSVTLLRNKSGKAWLFAICGQISHHHHHHLQYLHHHHHLHHFQWLGPAGGVGVQAMLTVHVHWAGENRPWSIRHMSRAVRQILWGYQHIMFTLHSNRAPIPPPGDLTLVCAMVVIFSPVSWNGCLWRTCPVVR